MRPTPKQLDRLPKWAKDYVDLLERRIAAQRGTILEIWQKEPTEFCIERYDYANDDAGAHLYLPLGQYDSLRVGDVRVQLRNGRCQAIVWSGRISVLPECSNLVSIERRAS